MHLVEGLRLASGPNCTGALKTPRGSFKKTVEGRNKQPWIPKAMASTWTGGQETPGSNPLYDLTNCLTFS